MRPDTVLPRPGRDGAGVGEREDGAVEGVFEGDDAGRAGVDVVGQDGVGSDVREGEVVGVCRGYAGDEGAGQGGDAAGFVSEDVGAVVAEDGVRGLGQVGAERELVAHGAGEDEEGGGVAGEVGEVGFEGDGCGVFEEDVVEEGGLGDGG